MRLRIRYAFALLLTLAAVSAFNAGAQTTTAPEKPARAELALDYSFVRSNAPPGGCTCINLNGGGANLAWPVAHSLAVVGDIDVTHAGSIGSSAYSLTLSTFTAGARYMPHLGHSRVQPFSQALAGVAHSSATLVESPNPASANAGAAFAAILGGGLDLKTSRRFSLRLIEADYLVTTFDNAANNHQNNLRIGAGVAIRF
jgi:peptidoglycan-associated lipoprotein